MTSLFRELLKPLDYFRREFIYFFYKDYYKNKLKKRNGKCKKCGKCCGDCFYLNEKTNLCKIYKKRPAFLCHKDFPLDNVDLWLWDIKDCGYSFIK